MNDVSKGEGRTVLFVSHNMLAIKNLCNKVICMKNGTTIFGGHVEDGIAYYNKEVSYEIKSKSDINIVLQEFEHPLHINSFSVLADSSKYFIDDDFTLSLSMRAEGKIEGLSVSISVCDEYGTGIFASNSPLFTIEGACKILATIPPNLLNDNTYSIILQIVKDASDVVLRKDNVIVFEMHEKERQGQYFGKWGGMVRPTLEWKLN